MCELLSGREPEWWRRREILSLIAAVLLLIVYLAVSYGHGLTLAFLNDDYLFLDKVRQSSFIDVWKPERLIFHWYRPWSRELHYWVLQRSVGLDETVYHLVSFALWLGIAVLFYTLTRRLAGHVAAVFATAGVAALALWSAPLLWIAGAQDLWMLLFGLLSLHAVARGWTLAAIAAFVLALLSKETAAVLPGIATALLWLPHRTTLRQALRRTAGAWIVLLAWICMHPTLSSRIFGPLQHSLEPERRPSAVVTVGKTLLAQINLEDHLAPETGWTFALWKGGLGAAILVAAIFLALRSRRSAQLPADPAIARRVILFGALWALMGWSILLLPSIGWHAYYGSLGSLGCWLAIGTALRHHRRSAVAFVVMLAFLREARATTPSWDWGTNWYQSRAGSLLGAIRTRLFQLHPELPAHSRLFFVHLPNNIGLLAGDGPAIRIWYEDPTLEAKYFSAYAPRAPEDSLGNDYFFRFDSLQVLVEIATGPEHLSLARQRNSRWQRDHDVLASLFMHAGNVSGAADEYARLFQAFPHRVDYALFAATAYDAIGASRPAREYYRAATKAYGDSAVRRHAPRLVRSARSFREAAIHKRATARGAAG